MKKYTEKEIAHFNDYFAPMTWQDAELFIRNWKNISSFFDKKVLEKPLSYFAIKDFSDTTYEHGPSVISSYMEAGYPCLNDKPILYPVTECMTYEGDTWERKVNKLALSTGCPISARLRKRSSLKSP